MADIFDRDPTCPGPYGKMLASNDVEMNKRPDGCCVDKAVDEACCETTAQNPKCMSALHAAAINLFNIFKDHKTDTISSYDWERMWINLEFPEEYWRDGHDRKHKPARNRKNKPARNRRNTPARNWKN